jgi:hypothetical protein
VLRAGTARHRDRRDGRAPIRLGTIAPVRETTSAAAMHLLIESRHSYVTVGIPR